MRTIKSLQDSYSYIPRRLLLMCLVAPELLYYVKMRPYFLLQNIIYLDPSAPYAPPQSVAHSTRDIAGDPLTPSHTRGPDSNIPSETVLGYLIGVHGRFPHRHCSSQSILSSSPKLRVEHYKGLAISATPIGSLAPTSALSGRIFLRRRLA